MYEEKNAEIDKQIHELIASYMELYPDVYADKNLPNDIDAIVLISLYPELKYDYFATQCIASYTENEAKIKELTEKKLEITKDRWWLYFGR